MVKFQKNLSILKSNSCFLRPIFRFIFEGLPPTCINVSPFFNFTPKAGFFFLKTIIKTDCYNINNFLEGGFESAEDTKDN